MDIKKTIDKYVMNTYGRAQINFVRGEGSTLWDDKGQAYLDFLAGIAVCNLGHANPEVARAVCNQALKLVHVSNLYYTEPQAAVARLLVENSFADRVFFCNSGAEANEGAIKLARLWGKNRLEGAYRIVAMKNSFHGRTLSTLTATGQEKVKTGFDPLPEGFCHVPYGDLDALRAEMAKGGVCAVLLEPMLGEGGVLPPPAEFMRSVRELCSGSGALMMLDEIQVGLGRTGRLFCHEHFGITPDVMTLAKALANGLPAGAVLAAGEAAETFKPGHHATTFGAGPVVMEAARVVLETLLRPGFLEDVRQKAAALQAGLNKLAEEYGDIISQVRGMGLLQGIVLKSSAAPLAAALLEQRFVVGVVQDNVLRLAPPLVIEQGDIEALLSALHKLLGKMKTA